MLVSKQNLSDLVSMSVVLGKDGDEESDVQLLDVLAGQPSDQEAKYVRLVEKGVPTPLEVFLSLL